MALDPRLLALLAAVSARANRQRTVARHQNPALRPARPRPQAAPAAALLASLAQGIQGLGSVSRLSTTNVPGSVNWGGQSFTDPNALYQWNRARGSQLSEQQFYASHPDAASLLGYRWARPRQRLQRRPTPPRPGPLAGYLQQARETF
jgi:hypothetical protein